jgi:catechol 2,3-dioxygenase-like lactoylglutathione lyase family enzyme
MKRSLAFYTGVLDFTIKYADTTDDETYITIINGDAEIVLSTFDGAIRAITDVLVDDVDALFEKYVSRGLDVSDKKGVHHGPLDQTWGRREFYVTDKDGHTLRFVKPII